MSDTVITGALSSAVTLIVAWGGWRYANRNTQQQSAAMVQVARIEADSATETHLWEFVAKQGEEIRALAEKLTGCGRRANEAEAKLLVAEEKLRILEKELREQLEDIEGLKAENQRLRHLLEDPQVKFARDTLIVKSDNGDE